MTESLEIVFVLASGRTAEPLGHQQELLPKDGNRQRAAAPGAPGPTEAAETRQYASAHILGAHLVFHCERCGHNEALPGMMDGDVLRFAGKGLGRKTRSSLLQLSQAPNPKF